MELELPHAPPSPTRRLDILFYSAPSSPRSSSILPDPSDDFEFDFSGHLDLPALSAADELFHAGKILPLKPPPAHHTSPISKPRGAFSPKHKPNVDFDPFEAALDFTRRSDSSRRGRANDPNPNQRRGTSRSLSPLRVSEFALQQQLQQQQQSNTCASPRGYKKWKLKDLLLFRSASEGSRPNPKLGPLNKNSVTESKRLYGADAITSSFRSAIGEGSSRRRSAHEIHYAANRAVSEDLKKKTSLPYKFGLLGCLGFNLSSSSRFREFSRGFGYNLSR